MRHKKKPRPTRVPAANERTPMKKRFLTKAQTYLCIAALCVLAVFELFFIFHTENPTEQKISSRPPLIALDPGSLSALAAIVYDPQDKRILFAKNDELQLPLASLTKLMTAHTALQALSATSSVRISKEAVATEGDSGLKVGEVWNATSLIKYALLVSSNDAMAAVAESAGSDSLIQKMNASARSLGLVQSYFLDPTGLDLTPGVSGAYGSARDVAVLAAVFYKEYPSFFESTASEEASYATGGNTLIGKATATPILDIPGLIGAKTGYTDLAGGNLVALVDVSLGRPLVVAVLHSTRDGRFDDVRTLIEAARSAL